MKEVQDERGKEKKVVVQTDGITTLTEVVEESVVSRTLGVHLRECPEAQTRIVQEKEVLR